MKYIILLFLSFLSFQTYARDEGYQAPAVCTSDGCFCPEGTKNIGNLCIRDADPDPFIPNNPSCVSGYETYPARGGSFNCFTPCRKFWKRVYDIDGFAEPNCSADCPPQYSLYEEEGMCKLYCGNEWIFEEYKGQCYYKCKAGEERDPIDKLCKVPKPPEPEIPQKNCETDIILAVVCMKNSIVTRTNIAKEINTEEKNRTIELLKNMQQGLDEVKQSNGNNTGNGNGETPTENNDYDINEFNADTPFIDLDERILDSNIFASNASCPKDNSIQLYGHTYSFKYSEICSNLQFLGQFVMVIAYLFAGYIIIKRS